MTKQKAFSSYSDPTVKVRNRRHFQKKLTYILHKNGIEPNISVDLPSEVENETVVPFEKDTQLQKAIEYINSKK